MGRPSLRFVCGWPRLVQFLLWFVECQSLGLGPIKCSCWGHYINNHKVTTTSNSNFNSHNPKSDTLLKHVVRICWLRIFRDRDKGRLRDMAIGFMKVQLVKAKGLRDTDIFGINKCLCLILFSKIAFTSLYISVLNNQWWKIKLFISKTNMFWFFVLLYFFLLKFTWVDKKILVHVLLS